MVSLELFTVLILPAALWPGGDPASNVNDYQEYLLGGKGGRCVELTTLPTSCADCLEMWESQPPRTLWTCNRPVLGLQYILINTRVLCSVSKRLLKGYVRRNF